MKIEITTTRGKVAVVDEADLAIVSEYKWRAIKGNKTWYAIGYKIGIPYAKNVQMHRLLMKAEVGQVVDHEDGNGMNNCRSNLRFCTNSENSANRHHRIGRSPYLGVAWHKRIAKWQATIKRNGKSFYLGVFSDPESAARVRDQKARELFGKYARCNFQEAA